MKNRSKANLDKITNVIDLHVDMKISNVMTAKHLVLELAHPADYNKHRSEKNMFFQLKDNAKNGAI